jgi:2-methylisocitrate lyase-like PEP mutase family enzyme
MENWFCGRSSPLKTLERRRADFRHLVESGKALLVPGVPNALSARVVEEQGFDAVYLTGAGLANTFLGMPDIGLMCMSEVVAHATAISSAVELPLIVDGDTGFGNAVNVWHTTRSFERAGAFAIQLEDQQFPKKCGHFEGKAVIGADAMVEKVRSAVAARTDPNFLIVARTDARATLGLTEAIRRVNLYRRAGADVLFVEAPQSEEEIRAIAAQVEGPKLLNIVEGGKTPALSLDHAAALGFAIVLYANIALVAHVHAIRELFSFLKQHGHVNGGPQRASFVERQALVRKPFFDELEQRFPG